MCRRTAPSSGCSTSAPAMRSRPSSFLRTIAARCASPARPVAPWAAVSAPPGHQGFSRNLTHGRDHGPAVVRRAQRCASARTRTERVISNVVMMGMGEPLQNYDQLVPSLKTMLDDHGYGPESPPRDRVDVRCRADDRPPARGLPRGAWPSACTRRPTPLRDQLVPLNKKYPIAELLGSLQPLPRRRRRATSSPSSTACCRR